MFLQNETKWSVKKYDTGPNQTVGYNIVVETVMGKQE